MQSWYIPLLVISTILATAVSLLWVIHVWKKRDNE
jgi:magnesium transporter